MPRPRNQHADRGETLLELLVAVVIMSVTVVAVFGGVVNTVMVADIHRKQAIAGAYVRDYAEAVQNVVAGGGYTSCAGTSAYQSPAGFTVPNGYTAAVTSVQYWSGSQWTSGCDPASDPGVQRVNLSVASSDGRAVETLTVVVRKPCPVSC